MATLPAVECSVSDCAFNHDGCNAFAVTMGAKGCSTFIELDVRGGLPTAKPQIGACQRIECAFNEHLECSANAVTIGENEQCLTFAAK